MLSKFQFYYDNRNAADKCDRREEALVAKALSEYFTRHGGITGKERLNPRGGLLGITYIFHQEMQQDIFIKHIWMEKHIVKIYGKSMKFSVL